MLIIAYLSTVLHYYVRFTRWHSASKSWAAGIFRNLIASGPINYDVYGGEMNFFKDAAKKIELELRWHTGSIKRLYSPLYYRIQDLSLVLAFICILLSKKNLLLMLVPFAFWLYGFSYFHFFGWRLLRRDCLRYQNQ
jgi:hypothetical protein